MLPAGAFGAVCPVGAILPTATAAGWRAGGTQSRLIFGGVDYQCVIKYSVETQASFSRVSTLYLKWILIISELQNTPWPRPANAHIGVL